MLSLFMEPYTMIQVSISLSVINQMGRNVAYMFCHEIIKIRVFVQGSLIDITIKNHVHFTRNLC